MQKSTLQKKKFHNLIFLLTENNAFLLFLCKGYIPEHLVFLSILLLLKFVLQLLPFLEKHYISFLFSCYSGVLHFCTI
jgi:hypothetical protein